MQLTKNTIASILAFTATATAAPFTARDTLQPWQVSGVAVFSPSGRPGQYPWPTITANVTDPNEILLGTAEDGTPVTLPAGSVAANCEAKWLTGTEPTNHFWPCDASGEGDGYWFMEVVAGANGFSSTNFDLKFTRVAQTLYRGSSYTKKFEGEGHFEIGQNLGGSCGGSGVCFWGLKPENSPFPVQQEEVAA